MNNSHALFIMGICGFLVSLSPMIIYQLFLQEYDIWNYVVLSTIVLMIISMPIMIIVGTFLESKIQKERSE